MFPRSIWRQQRPRRLPESLDVRTPSRLRPLLVALFALAAALTIGACGGGSETVSTKLVSQAVNTTSSGSAFRISIGGSFKIPQLSKPIPLNGAGVVDPRTRRGKVSVDMSSLGAMLGGQLGPTQKGALRIDEVFANRIIYMKSPFYSRFLPKGKTWLRLDLAAFGKKLGINLDQLSQFSGGDPRQTLDQLRAVSGDVKKLGSATVRGAKTTRYRAKVDLRRYPKLVPAAQRPAAEQGMKRLIQLTGTSTFPVDIWIDPQKRVRRIQLAYSFSPKGGSSSQKLTFNETVDIYDFGVAEKIATPPAGQTIDFTQLVTRLTQQRSLGRTGQ